MNWGYVVEVLLILVMASIFWFDPLCEQFEIMQFRILREYSIYEGRYIYRIEQRGLWRWKEPLSDIVGNSRNLFFDCKSAEDALDNWWLSQQPPDVILEKNFD